VWVKKRCPLGKDKLFSRKKERLWNRGEPKLENCSGNEEETKERWLPTSFHEDKWGQSEVTEKMPPQNWKSPGKKSLSM